MTDVLLPEVGMIYKLRNLNQWVKIIQLDLHNPENVWYAEVWMSEHAGWWSHQEWIHVDEMMLDRVRDR